MKSIRDLYNIHEGETCFVIGNGPSLNKVDFDSQYVSFGVNSIFLKTKDTGFKPTYFVVEDNLVFTENFDEINEYGCVIRLFAKEYAEQMQNEENLYYFEMNQDFYHKSRKGSYGIPKFNSTDKPEFFCGQSVTNINLQLAYYMGFKKVVMVGMDFSYSKPRGHVQEGNHIHASTDDENHFHPDYFGKGKTWKDPRLGRVLRCYHHAKFVFEVDGRDIVNGTVGGELELFPRITLGELGNC